MAITATKSTPKSPEILPADGGLLMEVWTIVHDGSDVDVVITGDSIKRIFGGICGDATHNITPGTSTTVTFTFGAAKTNLLKQDAIIWGKA